MLNQDSSDLLYKIYYSYQYTWVPGVRTMNLYLRKYDVFKLENAISKALISPPLLYPPPYLPHIKMILFSQGTRCLVRGRQWSPVAGGSVPCIQEQFQFFTLLHTQQTILKFKYSDLQRARGENLNIIRQGVYFYPQLLQALVRSGLTLNTVRKPAVIVIRFPL